MYCRHLGEISKKFKGIKKIDGNVSPLNRPINSWERDIIKGKRNHVFVPYTTFYFSPDTSIFTSVQMNLCVFINLSLGLNRKHLAHVCEISITRVRDLSHTCARSSPHVCEKLRIRTERLNVKDEGGS
jgi:hypothetical protein